MADLATVSDVEANYRSLRGQEVTNVPTWISGASAELHVRVSDLDARIAASTDYADHVRDQVVWAVLRWLHGRWESPFFFTEAEIVDLNDLPSSASSGLPQGEFPDVVCYPVF